MINYTEFTLDNGLRVIVHEDPSVQVAVMNILYRVGSRDESPDKTGFAHLFEHLMFGGSVNIPTYDEPLQRAGGENNAFTSSDITNYYLTVPAANLETGFWLESDRMLGLAFSEQSLEVQRKVVVEEFKQSYLNRPYGDAWLKLCPLSYQEHPYRWPVIGKEVAHTEQATLDDVKDFFGRYYVPNNAVLVVAGNVTLEQVKRLSAKWFGPIPAGKAVERNFPREPVQSAKRVANAEADVPAHAIYKTYRMCGRFDADYYATDLLSDILCRGDSSRLHQQLVKDEKVFTKLSAYVLGYLDPGMLLITGRVQDGISPEQAEQAVDGVIEKLKAQPLEDEELMKVKNQYAVSHQYEQVEVLGRAMNLAYASLGEDLSLVNQEVEKIEAVTAADIHRVAGEVLTNDNASVLYYRAKNGKTTGK